jgi:hypothetical protein
MGKFLEVRENLVNFPIRQHSTGDLGNGQRDLHLNFEASVFFV